MIVLKYKLLWTIVIIKSYADDIVSEERDEHIDNKDKNTFSKVQRRFLDDLNDESWHVSHLKDTDMTPRRSDCPEETFEEKVKRYRKSLQNDGALVEYVSADALPFNESDLITDVCRIPDKKDVFQIALQGKAITDTPRQENAKKLTTNEGLNNETKNNDGKAHTGGEDEHEKVNVATTTTKKAETPSEKPPNARKASEYQFSSIEYYDETFDFDADKICPDAVEQIVLEIDHIRMYDVRCEPILEWRSLE